MARQMFMRLDKTLRCVEIPCQERTGRRSEGSVAGQSAVDLARSGWWSLPTPPGLHAGATELPESSSFRYSGAVIQDRSYLESRSLGSAASWPTRLK